MINKVRLGIDLGYTYSRCGVLKRDKVEIIPYTEATRFIPSCVCYNPYSDEIVVGNAAKSNIRSNSQPVFHSKRLIGRKFKDADIQEDMKHRPYKMIEGKDGETLIELQYNKRTAKISAIDVSSEILKHVKRSADEFLAQDPKLPTEAVVTVPAYFNNQQRQNTIEAAEKANLKVIKIINEPTAAAIAYSYQHIEHCNNKSQTETLLIYDFGGGTFDVSIIQIKYDERKIRVLATGGDCHLGGEDITQNLYKYYLKLYEEKTDRVLNEQKKKN